MNNYFTTFKINHHIYQIKDAMGVLTTLIIGKEKALLIDTGYGLYNLKKYISNITTLPLIVVASHGHMDHTGGNYLFEQVYIDEKDINLCKKHNNKVWRQNEIDTALNLNLIDHTFDKENFLKQKEGNLIPLKPNQEFDLGSILVLTIPMEGHTKGSVGFYIKEEKILVVSDATCPFVLKIHRIVEEHAKAGEHIVIIGNDKHPEVEGIKGWCGPKNRTVIQNREEAENFAIDGKQKVCIVSQTTFNYKKFQELVEIICKKGYDIIVLNTICNATEERQTEARAIAKEAEAMIVIGGRSSSNTQKLFEICKMECENTYYIQTLDDLDLTKLKSIDNVGITAGASTPNNIIEEVQKNVRNEF